MAAIVCVGLACLDDLFTVRTLPTAGGKYFADNYAAATGERARCCFQTLLLEPNKRMRRVTETLTAAIPSPRSSSRSLSG